MPTLSGASWVRQFPTSTSTSDLDLPFRTGVDNFIAALQEAGASVSISATFRPVERAYLMHYSWRIANEKFDPEQVPAKEGVDIDWVHRDAKGKVDMTKSKIAASEMNRGYGSKFRPQLISNHTARTAVDMNVSNYLKKDIKNAEGKDVSIKTQKELWALGATYGVKKLVNDPPHWSSNGH